MDKKKTGKRKRKGSPNNPESIPQLCLTVIHLDEENK